MKIKKKDIEHLSELARLSLTDDEKSKFTRQLGSILDYMEKIQSVDTSTVKPESLLDASGDFRTDKEAASDIEEELIEQVPKKEGGAVKTPPVL